MIGFTTDFREAERAAAEPIVERLLATRGVRDQLVLALYNAAGPDQDCLSERGIRDVLAGLFGGEIPEKKTHEKDWEKVKDLLNDQEIGRNERLRRVGETFFRTFPGPHVFVLRSTYAVAAGLYDPDTNIMTLLPGSEVAVRPNSRYPGLKETISEIRTRPSTKRISEQTYRLGEALATISPAYAGCVVTGNKVGTRGWIGRDGNRFSVRVRTETGASLKNGLRVMFSRDDGSLLAEEKGDLR